MAPEHPIVQVRQGMAVHTSDEQPLGTVAQVWYGTDPTAPDAAGTEAVVEGLEVYQGGGMHRVLYVPVGAIADGPAGQVTLNVDAATVTAQEWATVPAWSATTPSGLQLAPPFVTPPLAIIDLPADARHATYRRTPKELIVLHATAGTDSRRWLSTDPNSSVSAHRLIAKDGTIYKIVPDEFVAHHVGRSRLGALPQYQGLNEEALGIELENLNTGTDPYPLPQLHACVRQVVEWWGAYGFLPLLYHRQIDTLGKTDPRGFPRAEFDHAVVAYLQEVLR
jgi:N-acetylmuramoyl-L-alanine amidase